MKSSSVYITRTASFLPNNVVKNEEMENILGMVGGQPSRVKNIILRQNQIKQRYYSMNAKGEIVYSNAQLTANAVKQLFDSELSIEDIDLLSCGTSVPDQLLPSHAVMVHGILATKPIEINSPSGVCCSGMHALIYAYMSIKSGLNNKAISTGSELVSPMLSAKNFEEEYKNLSEIEENPMIAFEKDFLRWMLSDGAGAFLLENQMRGELSFKIEWIESISYANELDVCMYAGGVIDENNKLRSWKSVDSTEWIKESYFSIKQNTRLLGEFVLKKGVQFIIESLQKNNTKCGDINYFLPHISSMYFFDRLKDEFVKNGVTIPDNKWFLNLPTVGNVGSASIYLMLDEFMKTFPLNNSDKVLLIVPESGRFSYSVALLTVAKSDIK